jgi:hypothetical protein
MNEENIGSESKSPEETPLSPEDAQKDKFEADAKVVIYQSPDLGLELNKVVACLKEGIDFGPKRLGPLKTVKLAKGEPNVILDSWLRKAGDQIKKKISFLDELAQKLIEIVDIFQRTPNRFEKREREILDNLVTKISGLIKQTQD